MSFEAPFDRELLERVRRLRADGMSVKQIARNLGEKPGIVAPLVRAVAAEEYPETSDPDLVRCWVSPGWSTGLTVRDHPEWRDIDHPDQGPGGMAAVLVARRHRTSRFSVCGYLIDTHCLGVKDVLGPRILSDRDLPPFVELYFDAFQAAGRPLRAPLELAQHLVHGSIEAAGRLGFAPCRDFAAVADHLGPWHGDSAITFGKNGAPFYVAGPYDDARSVVATLTETVGEGNFTFLVPVGPLR